MRNSEHGMRNGEGPADLKARTFEFSTRVMRLAERLEKLETEIAEGRRELEGFGG